MDKIIKVAKQYQIIKGTADQRELRCPKCKNVATQVPDGKGGFVCKCSTCGAQFKFQRL